MNKNNIKKAVLKSMFLDKQVDRYYRKFSRTHPGFMKEHPVSTLGYIAKLNHMQHKQGLLDDVAKPEMSLAYDIDPDDKVYYYKNCEERIPAEELYDKLKEYDVISFDIFDTLIYRKVELPNDVFAFLGSEIGHSDFQNIRKKAEDKAREIKFREEGTREVVLSEIYQILEDTYGINPKWQERECELEVEMSVVNPYMQFVYKKLQEDEKTLIITSDMYLPKPVIEKMLQKNGYEGYEHLYLSNEYKLRKGDGTLQKKVLNDYKGKKIIHIGDSQNGDVERSVRVGLQAVHNPNQILDYREIAVDGGAGSIYRAIINNTLNNGMWNETLYFEHGFRVGGILCTGFCEYLEELCQKRNIDKILFCARDCEIIWKIYNEYFGKVPNEYIEISRYAIMNAASERYIYDLVDRFVCRYAEQFRGAKTIECILKETGYGYLIPYLEEDDIDRFLFPAALNKKKIEDFLLKHKDIIIENNKKCKDAAKKYFTEAIGDAKNVLVVDIGWSGTCITALKYFVEEHLPELGCSLSGALMCTSRGRALINGMSDGTLDAYIYSPFKNMDLTRYMMPVKTPVEVQDQRHMPLEYLFTSTKGSLISYGIKDGEVCFEHTENVPSNDSEISDMQAGIFKFVSLYQEYTECLRIKPVISAYVAYMPLQEAIKHELYTYEVYKNFAYDACTAPYAESSSVRKFGELFEIQEHSSEIAIENKRKKILFVTPELIYAGAPRSMLRMCKVAITLGYQPVVWSVKSGPFIREYEKNNIPVRIVPEDALKKKSTLKEIKEFDMAVCNTIVTDKYARVCSYYIPTVWYIREATNIPDFCRNNDNRLYTLQHSKDMCCVSDYAADAIGEFTKQKIRIVHNSVEDEVDMAIPYVPGTDEKIKFVQFGTMEYRKGYDVLAAAYKAMPEEYRKVSELYFAGGFINSGAPYCSYLFHAIEGEKNIHYLGEIKGENKKIETLSKMDVIVVASRDESCSLVALEGAMLSRPIIVTENVGAKYMASEENGIIAKTGDVESLKKAMMYMIDHRQELPEMGVASRKNYEKMASMDSYTADMRELYSMTKRKGTFAFEMEAFSNRIVNSKVYRKTSISLNNFKTSIKRKRKEDVVISLTSHPGRIKCVSGTIESLLRQTAKPKKILLWLSKEQFPKMNEELPKELLKLTENTLFEIRWADGDMAPHKKYLYTAKEYPELPFIIVDDDAVYDEHLVEKLMNCYRKYPNSISCMRANLMTFRADGSPRIYDKWIMDYKILLDTPSFQLLPTGVGGVLYPPHSLPEETFNLEAIKQTCLYCDDLWLKLMAVYNGYSTVVPKDWCGYELFDGSQEVALWRHNVHRNNNDVSLENILEYFEKNMDGGKENVLGKMRKDRFC